MLKADPRLPWDQFDQTASTIDQRPPDDPAEPKADLYRNQSNLAFTIKAYLNYFEK